MSITCADRCIAKLHTAKAPQKTSGVKSINCVALRTQLKTVLLVKLDMVKDQPLQAEVPHRVEAGEEDVILAACQDLQELAVPPEDQDDQESQVPQDYPETQESHQFNHASQSHHLHVNHALPDHRDHLDHQDLQETLEPQEHQEIQELILHQAKQDQKDHQDPQDNPANPVRQESPEPQLKAAHHNQVPQDPLETQDHQDQPALQDSLVMTQARDPRDRKDHPDHQDPQETMDSQDHQDRQEHQEMPEKRVFARNTAPSMEVSSSKMELAVVKLKLSDVVGLFGVSTTVFHFVLLFIQYKHQKISFDGNFFIIA